MNSRKLIALAIVAATLPAAVAHAQQGKPVWRPDSQSEFEVDAQLRPWTIYDEGMETILDNVQSMAGVLELLRNDSLAQIQAKGHLRRAGVLQVMAVPLSEMSLGDGLRRFSVSRNEAGRSRSQSPKGTTQRQLSSFDG